MKTLADFKRTMVPGTFWEATHKYRGKNPTKPKSLGRRECVHINTVGFGFRSASGATSYCDWPRRKEVAFEGDIVTIKNTFTQLVYTKA